MKENDKFVEFANLNFNPCHDYNMTQLFLLTFPFCGRRVVYNMQKQLLDAIPYKSYGHVHSIHVLVKVFYIFRISSKGGFHVILCSVAPICEYNPIMAFHK